MVINEQLEEFAAKSGGRTLFIDLDRGLLQCDIDSDDLYCDGRHFTPAGYDMMAQVMQEPLKQWLDLAAPVQT